MASSGAEEVGVVARRSRWVLQVVAILLLTMVVAACNLSAPGSVPLPTNPSTPAQPPPPSGGIAGRVWLDRCATDQQEGAPPPGCVADPAGGFMPDGVMGADEAGIGGVQVSLAAGECPQQGPAIGAVTGPDGLYVFSSLPAGKYCVSIDPLQGSNASALGAGTWTYPGGSADAAQAQVSQSVQLAKDDVRTDVNFGWRRLEAASPEPTAAASPVPTDTPIPPATATALPSPSPTTTPALTATPGATPTLAAADPRDTLGEPAFQDTFTTAQNWALYEDDNVGFTLQDGKLRMQAFDPDFWEGWLLSWPVVSDFYLEMRATTGDCNGPDRYGLMARATSSDKGWVGYLFGVTCNGNYALRSWEGDSFRKIIDWTPSSLIRTGPSQTNRLGLWAEGDNLRLYINGTLVAEVQDQGHEQGKFGLFIGSGQTQDMTVWVEEVAYWTLP